MKICFTSYRAFADGPVRQPFPESDPANIAYALGGDYLSFYSLKQRSARELSNIFRPYDFVFVALDVEALELVRRIVAACSSCVATYSEGHLADYQHLSPSEQVTFLEILNAAQINFLYWEKYIPFYRALTTQTIAYLPYPYLFDVAQRYMMPHAQRQRTIALPSGLAGGTRNGLASLAVAKQLLQQEALDQIVCWLEAETFEQDAQAIEYFLFAEPFPLRRRERKFNWRRWLARSRTDYRPLLRLKQRIQRPHSNGSVIRGQARPLALLRRRGWLPYLAELAPAHLMIDLNSRKTVGRNALDCATLQIACVSTDRSDLQARLFPQTTLHDSWDIDAARALCQRLLDDENFFTEVITFAAEEAKQFDVPAFSRRFHRLSAQFLQPTNTPLTLEKRK